MFVVHFVNIFHNAYTQKCILQKCNQHTKCVSSEHYRQKNGKLETEKI